MEIKLLHMYADLMNLYGYWANVSALKIKLECRGANVTIRKHNIGDSIDFKEFDFIYIGSGTERSQGACMSDLAIRRPELSDFLDRGKVVLATGNSHELFGQSITTAAGHKYDALGFAGFDTVQDSTRVTGDCVFKCGFLPNKIIGFINRTGVVQSGNVPRAFQVESSPMNTSREGILQKNMIGTYLLGPVLVRNPDLLNFVADKLYKGNQVKEEVFLKFQEKAYAASRLLVPVGF